MLSPIYAVLVARYLCTMSDNALLKGLGETHKENAVWFPSPCLSMKHLNLSPLLVHPVPDSVKSNRVNIDSY
jgi:hypothetical protein